MLKSVDNVKKLITIHPEWTIQEIADYLGCSYSYVQRVIQKNETSYEYKNTDQIRINDILDSNEVQEFINSNFVSKDVVADHFEISVSSLNRFMKMHNIEYRNKKNLPIEEKNPKKIPSSEEIETKISSLGAKATLSRLSDEFDIGEKKMAEWLDGYGIRLRSQMTIEEIIKDIDLEEVKVKAITSSLDQALYKMAEDYNVTIRVMRRIFEMIDLPTKGVRGKPANIEIKIED